MGPIYPTSHMGQILKQTLTENWGCRRACRARTTSADRNTMDFKHTCDPFRGPELDGQERIVTTLSNEEAGAEEEDHWLHFGLDDDEITEYTALRDDIPEWLHTSLWNWIRDAFTIRDANAVEYMRRGVSVPTHIDLALVRKCERVLRVPLSWPQANVDFRTSVQWDYAKRTDRDVWRLVNYLLAHGRAHGGALKTILLDAGSVWTVADACKGRCRLLRRVPVGVAEAADAAFQQLNGGKKLAIAWEAAFGVDPDPTKAYSMAVKAVEDAAIPVVCANDTTATLGKVIGSVNAGTWKLPHLREDQDARTHDVLVGMMRTLWTGQHDRHGGPTTVGVPAVTQDEAESAVMLAVTLVGWFDTGKVQP